MQQQVEPDTMTEIGDTSDASTESEIIQLEENGQSTVSVGSRAPPRNRNNSTYITNGVTKELLNLRPRDYQEVSISEGQTENTDKGKKRPRSRRSDARNETLDSSNQTGSQETPITLQDDDDMGESPSTKYQKIRHISVTQHPLTTGVTTEVDVVKNSLPDRLKQLEAGIMHANHHLNQETAGIRYHLNKVVRQAKHDLWRSDKRAAYHLLDELLQSVLMRLDHGFLKIRDDFQSLGQESGNIIQELTILCDEKSD
ncbi:MAG: hypothetical protein M1816_003920 [Peltula sp. TS41687]|nr:MAG: hypothetical protein M1816_003920 [Peltula sp. TS41687]